MIKKIMAAVLVLTLLLSCVAFGKPSKWAREEVQSAERKGLVPEVLLSDYQNPINREEFCLMAVKLYSALSGKEAPKSDAVFTDTQSAEVASANALGIVNGTGGGMFSPAALITREEIATMFYRTIYAARPELQKADVLYNIIPDAAYVSEWASDAIKFVNMCEVMIGDENGNINPKQNTTREQAIIMTLRIYNALKPVAPVSPDVAMLFTTSGNTSANMQGGAFAIMSRYNGLYLSDNNGVYSKNGETVTGNKALAIYPDTDAVYYIKADDKSLYKVASGNETLIRKDCVAFSLSGEYIYIKSSDGKLISLKGGSETVIAEGVTSVPSPSATGVYYSDNNGIYHLKNTGEKETIYEGKTEDMIFSSNSFFFKNAEGYVCKVNTEGKEYKVITPVPATKFSIYSSNVAYTADGLYKCDIDGKFNIRLLDETNFLINSYSGKIYLKYENGSIFEFDPVIAVKTAIN